jgi:hypothetical protein
MRSKAYLKHLIGGRSAADIAKLVERPEGETLEYWTGKINNMRSSTSASIVSDEAAKLLAPVLGVTAQALLNPPADFVPVNGQPAAPSLDPQELKQQRWKALQQWMSHKGYTAKILAQKMREDPDGQDDFEADFADWANLRKTIPAALLHELCEKCGVSDPLTLVIQYTDDEREELGIKDTKPKTTDRKKTTKGPAAPVPAPVPAPAAAAPAAPVKRKMLIDLTQEESRALLEGEQRWEVSFGNDDEVVLELVVRTEMSKRLFQKKFM